MKKFTISFLNGDRASQEYEAKNFSEAVRLAIADGMDLRGVDLSFVRLTDVDFSGLDLTGASFEYTTFHDCCFKNTNLSEVNFSYAGFWECTLEGAVCDRTDFYYSSFVACNMRNAKLLMSRNLLAAVLGNLYDAVLPVNFILTCPR